MALSRLELAVVALVAVGMFFVEHSHRISIVTPSTAGLSEAETSVCPDSDSVPFSADCLAFIRGGGNVRAGLSTAARARTLASDARQRRHVDSASPACPANNENGPYSAACLSYLSGWFWQVAPAENGP